MVPAFAVAQKCQTPLLEIHYDWYSMQMVFGCLCHLGSVRRMKTRRPLTVFSVSARFIRGYEKGLNAVLSSHMDHIHVENYRIHQYLLRIGWSNIQYMFKLNRKEHDYFSSRTSTMRRRGECIASETGTVPCILRRHDCDVITLLFMF